MAGLRTSPFFPTSSSRSRLRSAEAAMTTATPMNVTASALSLTPGVYIIGGSVGFESATNTSITRLSAGISLTSSTLPTGVESVPVSGEILVQFSSAADVSNAISSLNIPTFMLTVTTTTTYYLVAQATFTVAGLFVFGSINATRIA